MVCPLRYVLFAVSAVVAVATLWVTMSETSKESEFEGMTTWQLVYEFMTGGYLWKRYKKWKDSKKDGPCADMAQSRTPENVKKHD
mmetsp:Transcript_19111/g.26899  ORF Transcript_19111/g.26899 Transcript_19111/m.26899 type:complete len:85 (+) Transcript_19111:204-458(+)